MFKNIPENVRQIMASTLPLLVVVALFIVVGQFGFAKIGQTRQQVAQSQRDRTVLSQKLDLLTSVAETVQTGSTASLTALPSANPSLIVISQLKILASANGLLLTNVKGAGEVKDNSGLSRVDIGFEVTGGRTQVIAFLKSIAGIAPITLVDKIKLNETAGSARASVNVRSFWAALPVKLPALTEPIGDLTADERKTLTDITALTQPGFVEVSASETAGKPDPFSP